MYLSLKRSYFRFYNRRQIAAMPAGGTQDVRCQTAASDYY